MQSYILKNTMIPKVFTGFKNIEGFSIGNFFEGRYSDRAYGRESRIYENNSLIQQYQLPMARGFRPRTH